MNDLSIIIINWNTKQLVLDCIASVHATVKNVGFEIHVVDNGSGDGSVEAVAKEYPYVRIIANKANMGFAKANNQAIRAMQAKYAVLLNSDTILKKGALEAMHAFMETHPRAGICGPQLLYEDGTKQTSYSTFPTLGEEFCSSAISRLLLPKKYRERAMRKSAIITRPATVDYIIGACMMVRKTAMDQVGLLDEDYFFCYEEVDWCLRMKKAGWEVWHLPDIEIFHLQNRSFIGINLKARAESWRSRYVFFNKSLKLSGLTSRALLLTGGMITVFHFLEYGLFNLLTLFTFKRLRTRWRMFAYLLVWHLRGRPETMCLPG